MTRSAGTSPPANVRTASVLLWVLVGVMAGRTLLIFLFLDDLLDAYADQAGLPRETADGAAPAYLPTAVLTLLVLGGLLALCAVQVRRGAGWARVVTAMFASVAALAGLQVLSQPSTVLFTMLGLLNAVLACAAVVLLFTRPANDFFREQRRLRRKAAPGQRSA